MRILSRRSLRRRGALLTGGVALACVVSVTAVALLKREPIPDFREYEAGPARKTEFFGFVRPLIEAENARVLEDRRRLEALSDGDEPGWLDRWWLHGLARGYGIDPDGDEAAELIDELLLRVDAVPVSLALAQAAKESAWGTSRFARQGNNLFGEWCYEPGCGLVPRSRGEGRSHEVEAFSSPGEAVASYVHNINTHDAYEGFREERARLRVGDRPLSGLHLVDQLERYSERRQAYVDEVKRMILTNDLEPGPDPAG